jgi:hypothetical protein
MKTETEFITKFFFRLAYFRAKLNSKFRKLGLR